MVASKVTISQETRAKLLNPILSPARKRELREELIKDSIRRATHGYRTKQELIAAGGFNPDAKSGSYASGFGMINSMIKRGVISHESTNAFKKRWTILADMKVTPSPKQIAKTIVPTVAPAAGTEVMVALEEYKEVDKIKLVDMAKEFAWRENSDSLRDFVAYMQNAIK